MYIFYFNGKDGTKDIRVFESVDKEIIEFKSQTLYKVFLNKEITGKSFIKVPLEEGRIYKRAFWLKDEDVVKADDIINDYKKQKYLDLLEKIEKLN